VVKLTAKVIDELSVFYGLAIRRNKDSAENMKKAIWSTLKHRRPIKIRSTITVRVEKTAGVSGRRQRLRTN